MKITSALVSWAFLATINAQSIVPSKLASGVSLNITILLPEALDDRADVKNKLIRKDDSVYHNVLANRAAAKMAIQDINADSEVFPNTLINGMNVNNWDPRYPTNYTDIDSGGFSAIQAIRAVKDNGSKFLLFKIRLFLAKRCYYLAIGVFGDYYDSTTR
jgi:hypothetical protein